MLDVEDDHLRRATGLATRLDHAGKRVESAHETEWAAGSAAPAERLIRRTQRRKIGASARSPLKEHAFGLGQGEDGVERIVHRVDETSRALRFLISGDTEFDTAEGRVPVPILTVGIGFDAVTANIEPDWRVEGRVLANKKMHKFVVECGTVFRSAEVALVESPVANGFGHAADELTDTGLALGSAELAVKVFAGNDVGRGHPPVFGNLDVFLFEDDVDFRVGDRGSAPFPFDFVVGRDTHLGKKPAEAKAVSL